jgi:hypothetical protein
VISTDANPNYRYNPDYKFKGVRSRKAFTIRPGPNNPVGSYWIGLSLEGYGIHGTAEPAKIGKTESHGCVRLTNWDAGFLGRNVKKGNRSRRVCRRTGPGAESKIGQVIADGLATTRRHIEQTPQRIGLIPGTNGTEVRAGRAQGIMRSEFRVRLPESVIPTGGKHRFRGSTRRFTGSKSRRLYALKQRPGQSIY